MTRNPIRRAQLIAPFGVGAMTVVKGGIGLITAGLDHWYKREDDVTKVDIEEYRLQEWRLQELLQVDHFRLPPDFRKRTLGQSVPNTNLSIPFLKFPQWHFCPRCHLLDHRPLSERNRPKCPECTNTYLFQVPFIAMCEAGHIQDFPWREWVHESVNPSCCGKLRLKATGSASLSGQKVECDECKASRYLTNITGAEKDGTTILSKNLAKNREYLCRGRKPWLGEDNDTECGCHLRGALRSASNVYFAKVKSAIYLPRGNEVIPQELISRFEEHPLFTLTETLLEALSNPDINVHNNFLVNRLRKLHRMLLEDYTDDQILRVIAIVFRKQETQASKSQSIFEDQEAQFRHDEYKILREVRNDDTLRIREDRFENYDFKISRAFSKIMLVDKLRETRVLSGFTRIFPENTQTLEQRKAMLRRMQTIDENWLPAYIVYGEGIFFEFNEDQLHEWENKPVVQDRIQNLEKRYQSVQKSKRLQQQLITPRFVLLHTFAHVLMNRLTFECGYSSTALRERLYVSTQSPHDMAGVLIYTADGDSEGTMGGLVRMGKPGYLEPTLKRALLNAAWCSADPVCMEIGGRGGQGPDSCNLAACHSCALVPETSCENFNRFLDRALLIGDLGNSEIGFFNINEL